MSASSSECSFKSCERPSKFIFSFHMSWPQTQHIMTAYSTCHDRILNMSSLHTQHVMTAYSTCHGRILYVSWPHIQCVMTAFSTCHDCILNVSWLHTPCVRVAYSMCHDCILNMSWPHTQQPRRIVLAMTMHAHIFYTLLKCNAFLSQFSFFIFLINKKLLSVST